MSGKEILAIELLDTQSGLKEAIGEYIKDVIDEDLCDEGIVQKIMKRRKIEWDTVDQYNYSFYDDPMWKRAWNKKVREIADELKLK